MKKVAVGLVVAVSIVTASACDGEGDGSPASPAAEPITNSETPWIPCAPPSSEPQGLASLLSVDDNRSEFRVGEPIPFTLLLVNCSNKQISRYYPDQQRYEFTVSQTQGDLIGGEVWRWSADRVFAQVVGTQTFEIRTPVRYTETWDQRDDSGHQVPEGHYQVLAIDVGCEDRQLRRCHFGPGVHFDIVP